MLLCVARLSHNVSHACIFYCTLTSIVLALCLDLHCLSVVFLLLLTVMPTWFTLQPCCCLPVAGGGGRVFVLFRSVVFLYTCSD